MTRQQPSLRMSSSALALIDQAQQKITELSSHVVDLQSVLTDKKARGAFGEVQLEALCT